MSLASEEATNLVDVHVHDRRHPNRKIRHAFGELCARIFFALHILWIRIVQWAANRVTERDYKSALSRTLWGKNTSTIDRKISQQDLVPIKKMVIIGDDFGLGVGDWSVLSSVGSNFCAGPLGLLRCLPWPLPYIKLPWYCLNRCVRCSTSADWAPPQDVEVTSGSGESVLVRSMKSAQKRKRPGYLFERVFDPIEGSDADAALVIAVVGTLDTCSPQQAAENILRLCESLVSRGCIVVIATPVIPGALLSPVKHPSPKQSPSSSSRERTDTAPHPSTPPAPSEFHMKAKLRLEERIAAVKHAVTSRWPDQGAAPVRVLRDPSDILYHQKHFRFSGHYISSAGYQQWGRQWSEDLAFALKAAEAADVNALVIENTATDKKNV